MNTEQKSIKQSELESKIITIAKFNYITKKDLTDSRVIYCGRHKSDEHYDFNPFNLGLGNPFSHKNTQNCVWRVDTLEECLGNYAEWLKYLIRNEHSQVNLTDWEQLYLCRFLHLCRILDSVGSMVCFCVNTGHNTKNTRIECHTQILWNTAVWYVSQGLNN